jgi:ATP-dependent Lhr-like helicase
MRARRGSHIVDTQSVSEIRRRLRYTWTPFFARFGALKPVQVESIPVILDGANVVLASPTASGKTEAVVAPVVERLKQEQWEGLAVLYVVPTRALANDTLARIEGPLQDIALRTVLKHGDRPHLAINQVPNLLITTPESLDSLICRRSGLFGKMRAVILDEIHLLDNSYRGDQLRLLLWRLRELAADKDFSVHLLSATLHSPDEVAARYVSRFRVVAVPSQRGIDYHLLGSHREVYELARDRGWTKLLCFCNLRESVEAVAAELTALWKPYPVVAHHGSLSRQEREEAEAVMREAKVAVCVATSTLEVGIDIGDIDLIVLAEPPWSIASLLQRIGRGNRRAGIACVAAIVRSDEDRLLLEEMLRAASAGVLPVEAYTPDPSVAVQQVFSYLYQHPQGVSKEVLSELLHPLGFDDDATTVLLGHLRRNGWLELRQGAWFASTKLMDQGEKGRIHSNIPDTQRYRVVDVDSGQDIGTIAGAFDTVFLLSGRSWKVISVGNGMIRARRCKAVSEAPVFQRRRHAGAFHWLLPPELRVMSEPSDEPQTASGC